MASPSIGIVGAGIGGLTTANALIKKGFTRVKIYDKAKCFVPTVGAGFGFSPNGQICLSSIGVTGYRDIIHPFHRLARLEKSGMKVRQDSPILKNMLDKYGFGIAGCLRADLVDVLAKPLVDQLHYSHELTGIRQDDSKVYLKFNNDGLEEEEDFDLVIGADGIHSRVAEQLQIDNTPPIYSEANIYYGVIPNPDGVEFQSEFVGLNNTVVQCPDGGEMITFLAGPEDERKCLVWACTYPAKEPPLASSEEEWSDARETKDIGILRSQYPDTHPVFELFEKTSPDRLLHFGLFYRKHKNVWSKGRVCLLGDSCHATLPYVGQGANQAIEDAIVLANCLDSNRTTSDDSSAGVDHDAAFQSYYSKRSGRTKKIVNLASFMDRLYHTRNPIIKTFAEVFFTLVLRGGLVTKQLEREIVEECPIKDFSQYRPK